MKPFSSTLFAACCVLIGATASAQMPPATPVPPPLPPGPLIQKRAPDFAKWVITIVSEPAGRTNSTSASTADAGADNKGKVVFEVTTTKTGKIMLREVRTPGGNVVPTWCVGGLQITISGGTSIVQAKIYNTDPTVPTPNYEDYTDSDFQGFDWIKTTNYTGIEEIHGRKCLVFQDAIKNGGGDTVIRSAHVDLETRLPVDLSIGGGTVNYAFMAPPATELALPSSVVQLLRNRQREMDSAIPGSQMR